MIDYDAMPTPNFSQSDHLIQVVDTDYLMTNSAAPASEANWSRSTLFAKAGCIRVQQDQD